MKLPVWSTGPTTMGFFIKYMQSFDAKRGIVECVIDRVIPFMHTLTLVFVCPIWEVVINVICIQERSPDLRAEIAEYLIFHDLNEVTELPEEVTRCRAMPSWFVWQCCWYYQDQSARKTWIYFFMRSSVLQPQNNSLFDMFMLTRVYGLYTNNCTLTAGICA